MMFKPRFNCVICNSNSNSISIFDADSTDASLYNFFIDYYKEVELNLLSTYIYEIRYCKLCDFFWQKYIPSNEFCFELYERWIDAEISKSKALFAVEGYRSRVNSLFSSFIKFKKNKNKLLRILDYGAGWGGWSFLAKDMGMQVSAFEISSKRINYLKERSIPVVSKLFPIKKYDLIILNQVLEHVVDINSLLIQLEQSCKMESYLIISVPNCKDIKHLIDKKKFKIGKNQLHPIEHLNGFTHSSLSKLLYKFGFKKISLFEGILINFSKVDKHLLSRVIAFIYNQSFSTSIIFKKVDKNG